MNDANKAALAALFGITPETHKHLFSAAHFECICCSKYLGRLESYLDEPDPVCCEQVGILCADSPHDFTGPDPLGPDADGVWLVPMLLWCKSKGLEPLIDGEYGPWNAMIQYDGLSESVGESPTAALLQACLAARVPEIVRAMEGER